MKYLYCLLLTTYSLLAFADDIEPIEESWVKEDIQFINNLKDKYRKDPLSIIPLLKPDLAIKKHLGYGYSYAEGSMGKGYVSTFYEILYKGDRPVSYKLTQQMPGDDRLTGRYRRLLEGMYSFSGGDILPLYYNKEMAAQPVEACAVSINLPLDIENYMTPYSGILYGSRGGYANTLLKNRQEYNSLKLKFDRQIYEYLLCSKNPAVRLTAIEYFTSKNIHDNERLNAKIEEVFKETPVVTTMAGCMVVQADSRELVNQLSGQVIE